MENIDCYLINHKMVNNVEIVWSIGKINAIIEWTKNYLKLVNHSRIERSVTSSPIDVMAQNILEWIQGIYNRQQGARKSKLMVGIKYNLKSF